MLNVGRERSGCARASPAAASSRSGRPGWPPCPCRPSQAGGGRRNKEKPGPIRNCITIFLVGSPGQLDTWDMKPDAPAEVRGKFKPIQTNVTGVQICEHFPLMARMMDKVALIRSLHHKTGATHENGQRWMMTGHDFNADSVKPHVGSVISRVFGSEGDLPANVILPGPIGNTGAGPLHGQTAGYLGSAHEPFFLERRPGPAGLQGGRPGSPGGRVRLRGSTPARACSNQLDELQRRTETRSTPDARQPPTSAPSAC